LGTVLYLNFMRYMALLFFMVGVFSIPNAHTNLLGDRFLNAEPITFAAARTSIANLGSSQWTPAGDRYCNGNGFAARVCVPGGWGANDTAWAYTCGTEPDLPGSGTVRACMHACVHVQQRSPWLPPARLAAAAVWLVCIRWAPADGGAWSCTDSGVRLPSCCNFAPPPSSRRAFERFPTCAHLFPRLHKRPRLCTRIRAR
jgi:hypothetical protein